MYWRSAWTSGVKGIKTAIVLGGRMGIVNEALVMPLGLEKRR